MASSIFNSLKRSEQIRRIYKIRWIIKNLDYEKEFKKLLLNEMVQVYFI